MRISNFSFLAILMLLVAACVSRQEPATSENAAAQAAAPPPASSAPSGPPPTGTWSGDYGPNADRRESIRVELQWEGKDLRGTVQAGFRSLELTKATFQPDTGAITMEFDAQDDGQNVHYTIEGKVEGNTMSGTWRHPAQRGDFRVTRE